MKFPQIATLFTIRVRLSWDREASTLTLYPSNDYEPIVADKSS